MLYLLLLLLLLLLPPTTSGDILHDSKIALCGGIAGGTATFLLYPMDTAKTLRQSNPTFYRSVPAAIQHVFNTHTHPFSRLYTGVLHSSLSSIPSSALYFGGYEFVKNRLTARTPPHLRNANNTIKPRPLRILVHSLAAASGNACSSALFVPKELIKQQVQANGGRSAVALSDVLAKNGVKGLFLGYQATMLRNIPGAVCRFGLYEELKFKFDATSSSPLKYFACGALSGAISSALTTPLDVVKTQLALKKIEQSSGVVGGLKTIYANHGLQGVYAGVGARMVWSGLFSAVGFGVFEGAKRVLRVEEEEEERKRKKKKTRILR